MFEPLAHPRVFGVPPGADFPAQLAKHICRSYNGRPPEDLARVQIIVNTQRMRRRLTELFSRGRARLHPRINLVSEVADLVPWADIPPLRSPLHRKIEFSRLILPLLSGDTPLAPRSAVYDLADSLAGLLDEMHSEGVRPEEVISLDTGEHSLHWQRSQAFLKIVQQYLALSADTFADPEQRRAFATDAIIAHWTESPPENPIILAGSTGSRGTTFRLMEAVARLPQGAVVLPGFDHNMPLPVWSMLQDDAGAEDHPQFRFAKFLAELGISKDGVETWPADAPDSDRNALISLALRPAPVTSQWRNEGPGLGDLNTATRSFSLIEAPQPRDEAMAIALALREAVEENITAALITPDRTLGRRVAAALGRWNIIPDDSGGQPLSLTPPGRFLRQVAGMIGQQVKSETLIALLKHPLCFTGSNSEFRGTHVLETLELEIFLRRKSVAFVDAGVLEAFSMKAKARVEWINWVLALVETLRETPAETLDACHIHLIRTAEEISNAPDGLGELWEKENGRIAWMACEALSDQAIANTPISFADYAKLLDQTLMEDGARVTEGLHPGVMIWGTLEARVQGADLVILGGLNEGTWPSRPGPDPWLSRQMRRDTGLLSPEREIGLAAHDFQQAAGAKRVILSRAKRDDEAEAVPARWINRLTNLLEGLPDQNGPEALEQMRSRGNFYLDVATALDMPDGAPSPVTRTAPAPAPHVRPKSFSVTEIERLIRDPFSLYAKHVLKLSALRPLRPEPDAAFRGEVFHKIMERFVNECAFDSVERTEEDLLSIARDVLGERVPWPAVQTLWFGRIEGAAGRLAANEFARRAAISRGETEIYGRTKLPGTPFELHGKADRIDQLISGGLAIYDYKSGSAPTLEQVRFYQRQLSLEAVMAELGAFEEFGKRTVERLEFLGLGRNGEDRVVPLDIYESTRKPKFTADFRTSTVQAELARLLQHFNQAAHGYMPRRAMEKMRFDGDFDHLARFGEWDETDPIETVNVP